MSNNFIPGGMSDEPKNFHFADDSTKAYVVAADEQDYETKHPLLRRIAMWVGIALVCAITLTVVADAIWGIL